MPSFTFYELWILNCAYTNLLLINPYEMQDNDNFGSNIAQE